MFNSKSNGISLYNFILRQVETILNDVNNVNEKTCDISKKKEKKKRIALVLINQHCLQGSQLSINQNKYL